MSQDENLLDFQRNRGDSDEIEILEVVGINESSLPDEVRRSGTGEDDADDASDADDADDEEIVLDIDAGEDDLPLLEPVAEPLPACSSGPTGVEDSGRERLLRLQADYDNLRKRIDRERDDHRELANSALVGRLLPILDNFERALSIPAANATEHLVLDGMVMVHRQLMDELRREGLRAVDAAGCDFDPAIHDAVATDPDSEAPHNTVLEELQRGYLFRDRLLRPAMVKVSIRAYGMPDRGSDDEET